jgi:IS30 family transposase
MPRKSDLLTIKNKKLDRRVKLTDDQREEIKDLKDGILSQRSVATMYNVSRRTIQFIWFPEQLEENKRRRAERGGSAQYYDRKKHAEAMKEHRNYKKELYSKGLI